MLTASVAISTNTSTALHRLCPQRLAASSCLPPLSLRLSPLRFSSSSSLSLLRRLRHHQTQMSQPTAVQHDTLSTSYWSKRWEAGDTVWHRADVNEDLLRCLPALDAVKSSVPAGRRPRIFLPLCGASVDLLYLLQQGWHVVGLDAVRQPLRDFVNAHREQLSDIRGEDSDHLSAQHLDLWCMDLFSPAVTAAALGGAMDAVWDRGSLVAIGLQQRAAYVSKITELLSKREKEANWLLNVFHYNADSAFVAPPHSVPRQTVEQLLSAHASRIELLHSHDSAARWAAVEGLKHFDVQTYAVTISK